MRVAARGAFAHLTFSLGSRILRAFCLTAPLATIVAVAATAGAQTFAVIHAFTGAGDGGVPMSGLTPGPGRSFYGTTSCCGSGFGTVFKLKAAGSGWVLNSLYRFRGNSDGSSPFGRVAVAPDGTLYGTTFAGGAGYNVCNAGCGTVFRLTPPPNAPVTALYSWYETVLYRFTGATDGGEPQGDLALDPAGNLYGTAYSPGAVYELSQGSGGWSESVLYSPGNYNALGGVSFDGSGNLYGVSPLGGNYGLGAVYELSPSGSGWTEQTIYSFTGQGDGTTPEAGLAIDSSGNLWGTTFYSNGYNGTVFDILAGGGTTQILYDLPLITGAPGGPIDKLAMDAAGNLYGTTYYGGAYGVGSVFELAPVANGWIYVPLHDFTGLSDGEFPVSGLVMDNNGKLYGTASQGGNGYGVIFEITP